MDTERNAAKEGRIMRITKSLEDLLEQHKIVAGSRRDATYTDTYTDKRIPKYQEQLIDLEAKKIPGKKVIRQP